MSREQQSESVMAFAARERPTTNERPTCRHCGKYRHAESGCYELIGYPIGWSTRGRGRGQCGGRGRGGRSGRGAEHESLNSAVAQAQQTTATVCEGLETSVSTTISGLTADQIQRLISLIDTPKAGYETLSGIKPWLIDSGASCHMTGDLKIMNEAQNIEPIAIGLPNGLIALASKQGSVALGKNLALRKLLYVPNLNCNLMSVAKLVKELNCTVTFCNDFCILQDCTSRTPIGLGQQRDGVYYYQGELKMKNQVNVMISQEIWHNRMGHPSSEVLTTLLKSLGIDSAMNNDAYGVCEACLQAKQSRV